MVSLLERMTTFPLSSTSWNSTPSPPIGISPSFEVPLGLEAASSSAMVSACNSLAGTILKEESFCPGNRSRSS